MNKYLILIILGVLIIGGGIVYRVFILPTGSAPVTTGVVKELTVIARKDAWLFEPEEIEVNRGDKIIMHVVNEDDYDHGIAIDAFGISQRMPANEIIKIEFVATQAGEFPFYCSVPCGEGEYQGKKRGHFDMVGKVKVKDLVREQN
jgi:heme/copper-type cytochrome/quinol oxidase subunit 2